MACLKSIPFPKAPWLQAKVWKTSIGITCYHKVLFFKETVPKEFPSEFVEMLQAVYDQGLQDKEAQINRKIKDIKKMIIELT